MSFARFIRQIKTKNVHRSIDSNLSHKTALASMDRYSHASLTSLYLPGSIGPAREEELSNRSDGHDAFTLFSKNKPSPYVAVNSRERHTHCPTKVQEAEQICKASHSGERLFGMISRCDSECEHGSITVIQLHRGVTQGFPRSFFCVHLNQMCLRLLHWLLSLYFYDNHVNHDNHDNH